MRIYFVGPRASGKTTLGQHLAERTGARFLDTDAVLASRLGMSISGYVAQNGWDKFRQEEHKGLRASIEMTDKAHSVIATGGGIVLLKENRDLLHTTGICLYIRVPVEEMVRRLKQDPAVAQRPSLTGKGLCEEVADVVREREPLYLQTAHHVLDGTKSVKASCEIILNILSKYKPLESRT